MISGNSIGGFPTPGGGGGGGGGLGTIEVNNLIQQAIATWGNIDLWDMSIRDSISTVVFPQASNGTLTNVTGSTYTVAKDNPSTVGPFQEIHASSTTAGFLAASTDTMAARIKLPVYDGNPSTTNLYAIFVFIRDINSTFNDCLGRLLGSAVYPSFVSLIIQPGMSGADGMIGFSYNEYTNGIAGASGSSLVPIPVTYGTDNLYLEYNPSTKQFSASTDTVASTNQFTFGTSSFAASTSIGIDIMYLFAGAVVAQETAFEFEMGTSNGGRIPFSTNIISDSTLPVDAQEGKEYICSGVGVFNGQSPEIGDLIKILEGPDILYLKNPSNLGGTTPFDETLVTNYTTTNLFNTVVPTRLYADTELQHNCSVTNQPNPLNGFRIHGSNAYTVDPGYTRAQARLTPIGVHDFRISHNNSTDPRNNIAAQTFGILICDENVETYFLTSAMGRDNVELANPNQVIGDYLKIEFTVTAGINITFPMNINIQSFGSMKVISRVNGVQNTLVNTTNQSFDPVYLSSVLRLDFVNGQIVLTSTSMPNPDDLLNSYVYEFNNTIFNYGTYDNINKFCDSARVYFYCFSEANPNATVPVTIVPSYNYYGYGARNIPEFDPTSFDYGRNYIASGYGTYNNQIVDDGDVFKVLTSLTEPDQLTITKKQLSYKDLVGLIQQKIAANNSDSSRALELFNEKREIVLCTSAGLDQSDNCMRDLAAGTGILCGVTVETNVGTFGVGTLLVITANKNLIPIYDYSSIVYGNRAYKFIGWIDTNRNLSANFTSTLKFFNGSSGGSAKPAPIYDASIGNWLSEAESLLPPAWYFESPLPGIVEYVHKGDFSPTNAYIDPTLSSYHIIKPMAYNYEFDRSLNIAFTNPNSSKAVCKGTIRVIVNDDHIGEHFRVNINSASYTQVIQHGSILEIDYVYLNNFENNNVIYVTDSRYVTTRVTSPLRYLTMTGAGTYNIGDINENETIFIYNNADTDPNPFIVRLGNALYGARVKIKVIGTVIDLAIQNTNFPNSGAMTYGTLVGSATTGSTYEFVHAGNGTWVSLS